MCIYAYIINVRNKICRKYMLKICEERCVTSGIIEKTSRKNLRTFWFTGDFIISVREEREIQKTLHVTFATKRYIIITVTKPSLVTSYTWYFTSTARTTDVQYYLRVTFKYVRNAILTKCRKWIKIDRQRARARGQ